MILDFIRNYNGSRLDAYPPQDPLDERDEDEQQENINLDYETEGQPWQPINLNIADNWRPGNWPECPVRFVDGKDVGQTIAWLRAPGGYPIPVRLAQVGGVVMRVVDGQCRREFEVVERAISMIVDAFPWNEIESFADALQVNGFRLLPATPGGGLSYDFERMRKATDNRSMDEMTIFEQAAIAQNPDVPTIVDGRLEPRRESFDPTQSPIFGVIKTHQRTYLDAQGMQVLYQLEAGQRTPAFTISQDKLPAVSWYVRLTGSGREMPNWGIVRVEVSQAWFEARGRDWQFVDYLSQTIYAYRCRERSYKRAAVSLHPIVRAEESLGSLFYPTGMLANRFYRLTGL